MFESVLVVASILALLFVGALEPSVGVRVGLVGASLALLVGICAGAVYHLRLRSALRAQNLLVPRWWVNPTKLHARLDDNARKQLAPSFYLGVACFAACTLGCATAATGVVRMYLAQP